MPTQEGWRFGQRPAASGTSWLAGAQAAEEQYNRAGVAAAATRQGKQGQREGPTEAPKGRQAGRVQLSVPLRWGRDSDVVEELAARQGGQRGVGAVEAGTAAPAMISFQSKSALEREGQLVREWGDGRLIVWAQMELPRDLELLQQLSRREAVVADTLLRAGRAEAGDAAGAGSGVAAVGAGREAVSRSGEAVEGEQSSSCDSVATEPVVSAALAQESPLAEKVAAMPAKDREEYLSWQRHEGGLVFFENTSKAAGANLVTRDGRSFLPSRFMLDTGADVPLMDLEYGKGMGLVPERMERGPLMRMADGQLRRAEYRFKEVKVVLAMGTPQEVGWSVNFLAVEGLKHLADALYPAMLDHQFGGAGVDRVSRVYRYRPKLGEGDKEVTGEIPVRCWRPDSQREETVGLVASVGGMLPSGEQEEQVEQLTAAVGGGTAASRAAVGAEGGEAAGRAAAGAGVWADPVGAGGGSVRVGLPSKALAGGVMRRKWRPAGADGRRRCSSSGIGRWHLVGAAPRVAAAVARAEGMVAHQPGMAAVVAAAEQREAAATGWGREKEVWREGAVMQLLQAGHRQVGEEWG